MSRFNCCFAAVGCGCMTAAGLRLSVLAVAPLSSIPGDMGGHGKLYLVFALIALIGLIGVKVYEHKKGDREEK